MKLSIAVLAAVALAGCATTQVPAGLQAGKFVAFSCADGKSFSVRAAEGGDTVRVRAHHGSAELDRKAGGVYEGDGYRLTTEGGVSLVHEGKPQGQGCKPAA
jgi:hypothetical protein